MRKTLLMAAVSALVAAQAVAQETHPSVSTAPTTDARYEMIQTSRQVRETYLLSRTSGLSWVLTKTEDGGLAWEDIKMESHPRDKFPKGGYGKPVYRIFISGIAANQTYLINTENGATWSLCREADKGYLFWKLVDGPD